MTAPELVEAIEIPRNKRDDIAFQYAMAIREHEAGDGFAWKIVNEAIIARWSKSALNYIKKAAWELVLISKTRSELPT